MRGYYGIGVFHSKHAENIGTLLRSAYSFGAAFVYTVGRRYHRQPSDAIGASRHVPVLHYRDLDDLVAHLPFGCPLVGVELDGRAVLLTEYKHRHAACYLLGAEDHGLTRDALNRCHDVVAISGANLCLNVAVAGSIVMYDRAVKGATP